MTEIAKCVCGSERRVIPTMLGEFRIACSGCGWSVIQKTEAEAVAAWNAVMRPKRMTVLRETDCRHGVLGQCDVCFDVETTDDK